MEKICECNRGREYFHGVPHARLRDDLRDKWQNEILGLNYSLEMTRAEENDFGLAAYRAAQRFVSPEIREGLSKLKEADGDNALVISGVPCVVPNDSDSKTGKEQFAGLVTPAVLFGLVILTGGIPFSYWEEQYGRLLHDIKKVLGRELTKSSQGIVKLPFHTDGAWFRECFRPNFLVLAGLENENNVATSLLHVEKDILRDIPGRLRKEAETEQFTYGFGDAFITDDITAGVKRRSIIYYDESDRVRIALPSSEFPQETDRATKTLQEFREYLATLPARKIPLREGRVLFFDNTRWVHGRDEIEGKRWLQRLYFRMSLAEMQRATKTSVKENRFRALDLFFCGN